MGPRTLVFRCLNDAAVLIRFGAYTTPQCLLDLELPKQLQINDRLRHPDQAQCSPFHLGAHR